MQVSQGGLRLIAPGDIPPSVSIVCVTFNAVKNLPQLIKSVSDYKNDFIEFIVIDGNSTDGTVKILEENEAIIDFWISEPDSGIYDAMNKAINFVHGKWLIFLGADDFLEKEFNKVIPALKDDKTIYYGNVIFYDKEFSKIYDDYYLTKLNICHQAIFYPRHIFNKYKFDLKYKVYADYHLNLRCWKDPEFKFQHLEYLVSCFSDGGYSASTTDLVFEQDRNFLFKKYLKPASYYRYLNRTVGFLKMFKLLLQNK